MTPPRSLSTALLLMGLAVTLGACSAPTQPEPAEPPPPPVATPEAPVRTTITDKAAFDAFIAARPTPEALRQRYPGLLVVMPGDIATRELRMDNSRYFAEVDAEGRVTGGRFQ